MSRAIARDRVKATSPLRVVSDPPSETTRRAPVVGTRKALRWRHTVKPKRFHRVPPLPRRWKQRRRPYSTLFLAPSRQYCASTRGRVIGSKMSLKVRGRATGMILFARTNNFFVFFLSERNFCGFYQICSDVHKLEQIVYKVRTNWNKTGFALICANLCYHRKPHKLDKIRYSGVAMPRRKDDFSYSPGVLAKKMGVTKRITGSDQIATRQALEGEMRLNFYRKKTENENPPPAPPRRGGENRTSCARSIATSWCFLVN